jgi:UDPglucose--hexose-1-phosphate uridylyltransferase
MPELRKDPVVGRWVIIATERGKRPSDFGKEEEPKTGGVCPFCAGHENTTPPEILAYREKGTEPNQPGWRVRVVSNKFPALRIEGDLTRVGEGIYDKMTGVGAHEVVIETPDHSKTLPDLDIKQVEETLSACCERIEDLRKDIRMQYVLVFKNHGIRAGASLEHSHTQLIATPIVPKSVQEELAGSKSYFGYKERCIFCDIIRQELQDTRRLVADNDEFISIEPYAARFPFETWILPKRHRTSFERVRTERIDLLAEILRETMRRINGALARPPYNIVFHTGPLATPELDYYHWHLEIMPRLTRVAGFERGSGFYINPTPPEEAAAFLRDLVID